MKRLFPLAISLCWLACLHVRAPGPKSLPRIAIAGLGIESSTFSPALTDEAAFHARYDSAVFAAYPFLSIDSPLRHRAIWIPTITGHALPGGAVTRAAYESLVGATLDLLKKNGPYDGLFFVRLAENTGDVTWTLTKILSRPEFKSPNGPFLIYASIPGPELIDRAIIKIGYLEPELYAMRADWIMALTPGGVDQDIEHLTYKRIERPMFPFDKTMRDPDLSARMVSSSDQIH